MDLISPVTNFFKNIFKSIMDLFGGKPVNSRACIRRRSTMSGADSVIWSV